MADAWTHRDSKWHELGGCGVLETALLVSMHARIDALRFASFAPQVIAWQRSHGRHGLAWQVNRTPYSVWVSEIMLQQTQVSTVLAYYPRFMSRFPNVQAVAQAEADEVMSLWTGLGYYSRARNLHRCAKQVVTLWAGEFPAKSSQLESLAGIGPSTAAAIASFCFDEAVSIFDGNVKRVLSRWLAFEGDLGSTVVANELLAFAQLLLPKEREPGDMPSYTQGLMDLGAIVCTSKKPRCESCPLTQSCGAHAGGLTAQIPVKTKRVKRTAESWWLLFRTRGEGAKTEIWLQRRPESGIWSGLYAPVVYPSLCELKDAITAQKVDEVNYGAPILHMLTHRQLTLYPVQLRSEFSVSDEALSPAGKWLGISNLHTVGLPAPVLSWLQRQASFAQYAHRH